MNIKSLVLFTAALVFCLFTSTELIAQESLKIAVLPYIPTFTGPQIKKTDEVTLAKMMETDAYSAQKTMYRVLSENKANFESKLQDYNVTNKLLKKAGIKYYNIASKSNAELCKILGADILVVGKLEKKMKSAAADITLGAFGSTVRYICSTYKKDSDEELKGYNVLWKIGLAGKYDSDKIYSKIAKAAYKKIKKGL